MRLSAKPRVSVERLWRKFGGLIRVVCLHIINDRYRPRDNFM